MSALNHLVSEAVDVVVHCERTSEAPGGVHHRGRGHDHGPTAPASR
ncbi:MAG: hypothetical protein R2695_04275 [Acidimicrobiales bacterium]